MICSCQSLKEPHGSIIFSGLTVLLLVSFVDMGGHGYAVVRASNDDLETEFVCIERPVNRHDQPDGGPLNYRVRFRAPLWRKGETPKLDTKVVEGDPKFSV